jgi:GGDEF domain-containing protein
MTTPEQTGLETSPISVDPLTSFGSRDALIHDLEHALGPDGPHRLLAVFDLAGLDDYRRAKGTIATDELTLRMARVFADRLGDAARCYPAGTSSALSSKVRSTRRDRFSTLSR